MIIAYLKGSSGFPDFECFTLEELIEEVVNHFAKSEDNYFLGFDRITDEDDIDIEDDIVVIEREIGEQLYGEL